MNLVTTDIAALSREYLYVNVTVDDLQGIEDPSLDVVAFCFNPDLADSPTSSATWLTGGWVASGGPSQWTAWVLVGSSPGVFQGQPGQTFALWVKITDSPEVPIKRAGVVTFT